MTQQLITLPRELVEQVLNALLAAQPDYMLAISNHEADKSHKAAIGICREALSQASEVEPVAYYTCKGNWPRVVLAIDGNYDGYEVPLYAAPTKRRPLTGEEIDEIYFKSSFEVDNRCEEIYAFVRAIEAAHGIGVTNE